MQKNKHGLSRCNKPTLPTTNMQFIMPANGKSEWQIIVCCLCLVQATINANKRTKKHT